MLLSSGTKCNLIRRKQKSRPAVQLYEARSMQQYHTMVGKVKGYDTGTESFMQLIRVIYCSSFLCDRLSPNFKEPF